MTQAIKPKTNDAVLGGQNQPVGTAAVLGGFPGLKQQIKNLSSKAAVTLLTKTVINNYQQGVDLGMHYFGHPDHGQFFADAVCAGRVPKIGKQKLAANLGCSQRTVTINLCWVGPYLEAESSKETQEMKKFLTDGSIAIATVRVKRPKSLHVLRPHAYPETQLADICAVLENENHPDSLKLARLCREPVWDLAAIALLVNLEAYQRSRGIPVMYRRMNYDCWWKMR